MAQSASSEVFAPGMSPQDPIEYDKWFRAQVQAALDDPRPSIPHTQAMAEIRALLAKKASAQASSDQK